MLALFVLSLICLGVALLINFGTALHDTESVGSFFLVIFLALIMFGLPIITLSLMFAKMH